MSKRKSKQGNHGIYQLTCISHKCSRRFKVIYDVRRLSALQQSKWAAEANIYNPKPAIDYIKLTYPFTGCPFCGAWWCTGPLDGEAYPKSLKDDTVFDPIPPFDRDIGVFINRRQSGQ